MGGGYEIGRLSGAFYALVEKLVSHYRPHGMNKALTVCFCLRRRQQYMQNTKATKLSFLFSLKSWR